MHMVRARLTHMAQNQLLLLSLVTFFSSCTAHTKYTVFPTKSCVDDATIGGNSTECLTLSSAAKQPYKYFTTNATLIFSPGDHSLRGELVSIANISGLTFISSSGSNESNPRILCDNSSFSFSSVSDVHIESISFISCSLNFSSTMARLHFCWFENGTADVGGAIAAHHRSEIHFSGESRFLGNKATRGGAMFVSSSNLTFSGQSTFLDNAAGYDGGGLYIREHSVVIFNGSSTFAGNSAEADCGALKTFHSNIVSFHGRSTFFGNTAGHDGGAVCASFNDTVSFSGASTFHDNTARKCGGALSAYCSSVSFSGRSTFHDNIATDYGGTIFASEAKSVSFNGISAFYDNIALKGDGGAVYASHSNTVSFYGTTSFHGNTALKGGAVYFIMSTVSFSGTSIFHDNTVIFLRNKYDYFKPSGGGAVGASKSTLNFCGTTTFNNNTASDGNGGAVIADLFTVATFNGTSTFCDNTANADGGALYVRFSRVSFRGTSTFHDNMAADNGGAFYAYDARSVNFNGVSVFHDNAALQGNGGAVDVTYTNVELCGNSSFKDNIAMSSGGAIASYRGSELTFCGVTNLIRNRALFGGGISSGLDSIVNLTGTIEITQNQATYGGGIFVRGGNVSMDVSNAIFRNNFATEPKLVGSNSGSGFGGAIHAVSSRLYLKGNYTLTENTAVFGGGFAFAGLESTVLLLESGTQLSFVGNKAHRRGGAIHVEDDPFSYCVLEDPDKGSFQDACFLQINEEVCWEIDLPYSYYISDCRTISLSFTNNTAIESGGSLYGGGLEDCEVCAGYLPYTGVDILEAFTVRPNISELEIASDPLKVCSCEEGHLNCSSSYLEFSAYPGETLSVSVVAVGQMDGIVPSVIRAVSEELNLTSEYTTLPAENKKCTDLHYPLLTSSVNQSLTVELFSDEPCSTSGYPLTVTIVVHPCPIGFSLTHQGECSCEDRLRTYTHECNITTQTITRREGSSFWVGVDHQDDISDRLILNTHCPFDYCTDQTVVFPLNKTDTQCRNGRSGVLCGGCQSGYSLVLGKSRCISDCSNVLLVLTLAFIAAGLALVIFLFLCNLTVAKGTLSGLIFYANVLAINQAVFFPFSSEESTASFLTVFIAWLNLDLGIETCFFTGLDVYGRTWLQYAFPLYIWVLVGLIVYLARVSTTVAKFISHTNPVAVLATLFLLSYTKLLRTIMAAFSFTTLSYPEGETRLVWLYDGNSGYWDGKHLVLLLVSLLVFCILYLPYTVFLVCGRWVQTLRWIPTAKRLYMKSFYDAYCAPYQDKHYYWTGLLLLVRFLLLLVSTIINIGSPQDPHTNLLVVVLVVTCLLMWISRGVYRMWYNTVLEAVFLFNIIVLSVGTYHVRLSGGNQAALVYTSISVSFFTFIVIVAGAVVQLKNTWFVKSISRQIIHLCCPKQRGFDHVAVEEEEESEEEQHQAPTVTTSVVEIGGNKQSGFANYRETVLDLVQ